MKFLYVPPHALWSLHGTGSGTVESTYDPNWLADGLPGKPVRGTGANPAWTVAKAAALVNFAAVLNSNASPGSTAGVNGLGLTLTQPTAPGRVPFNPWAVKPLLATSSQSSVTFTFAGNTVDPLIVGQLVVGRAYELERPIQPGGDRAYRTFNRQPDPSVDGQLRVYRRDKQGRVFRGSTTVTAAGLAALIAWWESTNDNELLSVIVPDPLLQDAWAVKWETPLAYKKQGPDEYHVTLNLRELPRKRW